MDEGGPGRAGRRWNILLLYLLATLTTTSHGSMELILPLNLDRLGHPLPLVGATVALLGLGSLVSRIPAGAWYGLARARLLIAGALVSMGLSTLGLARGDVWAAQAILGALHGFAFGLVTTFLLALLIELRPRHEQAAPVMAWYTAAISAGYAIGALLGAQSIGWLGYPGAFGASGLVGLVGAGASLALRPPRAEGSVARPGRERSVAPLQGWRGLVGLPMGVWLATLLAFYINFVSDTYSTFFPIHAVGVGISLGAVGVLKSVHSLSATGIRFVAVALFRFVEAGIVNHVAVVGMALATVALSVLTGELLLALVFVALGTCRGLIRVTTATMVAEERKDPRANIGMAAGVYNAGLDAGSMLGPPVAGAVAGLLDIPTTFRVVGLALPALYYVVWFAQRNRRLAGAPATRPRAGR